MPLTAKGEEIKSALVKEYGEKKGESVLYAGKNAGTFTGIDARLDKLAKVDAAISEMNKNAEWLGQRMDAMIDRRAKDCM